MTLLDHIRLVGIECEARIGVSDQERSSPQKLKIDVDLALDLEPAGNSDRLDLTLDYAEIVRWIRSEVAGSRCKLLEALANRLVQELLALPRVESVHLEIHKYPADLVNELQKVTVSVSRKNTTH